MIIHCLSLVSKISFIYIHAIHFSPYLLCAFSSLYFCYFAIFVIKMGRKLNYLNKRGKKKKNNENT